MSINRKFNYICTIQKQLALQNYQYSDNVKGEEIGDKIRHAIVDARKEDGSRWTQKEVAKEIGLSKDHLSRVVLGRSEISIEKLMAIAKLFNVGFRLAVEDGFVTVNDEADKIY